MAAKDFYRLISEAVADLTEYGFDSQERLDRWLGRLEQAARAALVPEAVLRERVQEMLTRVYERMVERGGLLRSHPGISRFTLMAVKPKLRAELDRHVMASAGLIRLNRDESVQRVLRRFAGWATSIPAGGTRVPEAREAAATVRRGIAGLPFEERRVIIDQGHKLASSVDRIVAVDAGAIAAQWRHAMEAGGGYDPRPEHVARNGTMFVLRDNWALQQGLMKLAGAQYTDEVEQPAQLPYCRCRWSWLYHLRDLPQRFVTNKGRDELARVRAQIARV